MREDRHRDRRARARISRCSDVRHSLLAGQLVGRVVERDDRVGRRIPRAAGRCRWRCRRTGRAARRTRRRDRTRPSRVRSSCACVGLTVVTASAKTRPPLSRFTRPYHSSCRQLYSAAGRPRSAIASAGKCPWNPALCTESTTFTRRKRSIGREVRAQVDRRERRVPVVRVDDDRRRSEVRERRQRRHDEERVPPVVVRIVAARFAVDPRPLEVLRVRDEEDARRVRRGPGLRADEAIDARLLAPRADLDAKGRTHRREPGHDVPHPRVERHDDHRRRARRGLMAGEPAHRFTESTGSRERRQLGGGCTTPNAGAGAGAYGGMTAAATVASIRSVW